MSVFSHILKTSPAYKPDNAQPAICYIPVKATSLRCPGKNHAKIGGHPIWHIAVARALRVFDKVVVDTDDLEILDDPALAEHRESLNDFNGPHGRLAIIPRHPSCLAPSTNGNDLYKVWDSYTPQGHLVAQFYVTCPFIHTTTLAQCWQQASTPTLQAATVCRQVYEFVWEYEEKTDWFVPNYTGLPRSQDLAPRIVETTAIYITKKDCDTRTPLDHTGLTFIDCSVQALDINSLSDLLIAQSVGNALAKGAHHDTEPRYAANFESLSRDFRETVSLLGR